MSSVPREMDSLEDFVEKLVRRHPSAAKNYNILILLTFFYKTGNRNLIQFTNHDLGNMPSCTSISRAWRAVKLREPQLADPDIEDVREDRAQQFRLHYSPRRVTI